MSRPSRLKEFDYTGQFRYFLTFCTYQRAERFTDESLANFVSAQLLHSALEYAIDVDAYCVMPDHVHALVTGAADDANVCSYLEDAKQRTGWCFRRDRGQRLWQKGYFDRVLRDEDDTASVTAYIINNPLRAGLVKAPEDYPFWGSGKWSRDELLEFIAGAQDWKPPW